MPGHNKENFKEETIGEDIDILNIGTPMDNKREGGN